MSDTIAAIATGGGVSAIGIIRLSGDKSIEIADRVFRARSGKKMAACPDRKLSYGKLIDENGDTLDLCLCTVSRGPDSYTGEDTAEFQCHGGPVLLAAGLRALFSAGARQALPGEFTKRAFLNGRLDLSQAEAVIDLIEAETTAAAKNAAGQLCGAVSRKADEVYTGLVDIMSHFHAVLDYPDEDIEEFELRCYLETLKAARLTLGRLLETYSRGQVLKDGIKCAIIGRPNTGKSSLLNALVGYDRAIVTEIAGTTRDTVEEKVRFGNVLLRLIDTAGIRETFDAVEKLGVCRALSASEEAELVLIVFDGSEDLSDGDYAVMDSIKNTDAVAVVNKADLEQKIDLEAMNDRFSSVCIISSLTGEGIDKLEKTVSDMFSGFEPVPQGELLTNARQADAVGRAISGIERAEEAVSDGITPDAVLTEIEYAIQALGEITGRTMRDDVTERIFERFCVGK